MDGMAEKIQSLLNDEESMRQIRELAEMFGGDKPHEGSPFEGSPAPDSCDTPPLHNIDIGKLMSLTSSLSENDPACNLIMSLKPFLSREKQQKADKAVKMLRLYNLYIKMKDSGMLNNLIWWRDCCIMYDKGSIAAAENRVREMNRVTKQYLDRANSSMTGGNVPPPPARHGGRANVTGTTRFEPVQNPSVSRNPPRDPHPPHPPNPPHEAEKEEEPCGFSLRSLQGMGGDGILVILIIMLLMEEKSDMRLIAALIYMLI